MRSGPFILGRSQTAEIGVCSRSEISGMLWCGGRKKMGLSQRLKTLWRGHPLRNDLNRERQKVGGQAARRLDPRPSDALLEGEQVPMRLEMKPHASHRAFC